MDSGGDCKVLQKFSFSLLDKVASSGFGGGPHVSVGEVWFETDSNSV